MNDYNKFILNLSDEVRAQRKREKRIKLLKEAAFQIAIAAVAAVLGGLALSLLQ